jgi:hypothetical protein
LSRLAQVDVKVDEAGGDDQAAGVEFFVRATANFIGRSHFRYAAIAQEDVHGRVDLFGWIDDVAAFDQE